MSLNHSSQVDTLIKSKSSMRRLVDLSLVVLSVLALLSREVLSLRPQRVVAKSKLADKSTYLLLPTSVISNQCTSCYMSSSTTLSVIETSSRVQRIKDISLQKDILRDITACELALRIEVVKKDDMTPTIDYRKLISKLDDNIAILTGRNLQNLIPRIISVKEQLLAAFSDQVPVIEVVGTEEVVGVEDTVANAVDVEKASKEMVEELIDANKEIVEELKAKVDERIRILVREDGSVDWEGAKASGKEVAKFGTELWERLNGKEEEEGMPSIAEIFGQVQAIEPETEEIKRLTAIVQQAKDDVTQAEEAFKSLRAALRQDRKERKELNDKDLVTLRK